MYRFFGFVFCLYGMQMIGVVTTGIITDNVTLGVGIPFTIIMAMHTISCVVWLWNKYKNGRTKLGLSLFALFFGTYIFFVSGKVVGKIAIGGLLPGYLNNYKDFFVDYIVAATALSFIYITIGLRLRKKRKGLLPEKERRV